MQASKFKYSFEGKVWRSKGPGGWYFVTLPKLVSDQIKETHRVSEEGWGRLKTTATLERTKWQTALWYDSKSCGYILPIKAQIRKKESVLEGTMVKVVIEFELEKWMIDMVYAD